MSNIHDLAQIIREHPFSQGMSDEHIQLLTGCAKNTHFSDGAYLFREGDDADTFYWIRAGKVAMEFHAPPRGTLQIDCRKAGEPRGTLQIDCRKAGDALGWSWIVEPYRWFCDARALEDTRALAFDATCLRGKMEHDLQLACALYRRFVPLMYRGLQRTQLQLLDVYGGN